MNNEPEIEDTRVYIIVGRAWQPKPEGGEADANEGDPVSVNVVLTAPDDEECIKRALTALAGQGYGRVELDRVGVLDGEPDDPTFASAYWTAIDGQVAVIAFLS